ncbi:MAG TPA: HNH endonuclease family protein [Mycobacteriales bacterium]|nr:HNH endonuclease family protein [Mycobacteriales bacterium]
MRTHRTSLVAMVAALAVAVTIAVPATARPSVPSQTRSARWLLSHLTVGPTSAPGYVRSAFKLWDSAGHGCDVRDEVLIRDAVQVHVGPGCALTGKWRSPYDGVVTTNPTQEQVDHVVPLADAWGAGAWQWTAKTREAYANDLGTNFDLLAVSAYSNESKSDRDPSSYLPPRTSFDCRYMTYYVAVLWRWRLDISQSLKEFLSPRLASCPQVSVVEPPRPPIAYATSPAPSPTPTPTVSTTPIASPTPRPTPATTPSPTPTPTPTFVAPSPTPTVSHACTQTSTGSCIRAGEFCSNAAEGTYGYDASGNRLYCSGGHWHYA